MFDPPRTHEAAAGSFQSLRRWRIIQPSGSLSARIAQRIAASVYGTEGRRFESSCGHMKRWFNKQFPYYRLCLRPWCFKTQTNDSRCWRHQGK